MMDAPMPCTGSTKMSAKEKKEYEDQEKKWRAESDLRTLVDAEKIKSDPDRLKAAMKMKREQMDALKNIKAD